MVVDSQEEEGEFVRIDELIPVLIGSPHPMDDICFRSASVTKVTTRLRRAVRRGAGAAPCDVSRNLEGVSSPLAGCSTFAWNVNCRRVGGFY